MKKWTKSIIGVVSIIAIIIIAMLVFYLTRPLVVYIESPTLANLSLSPFCSISPSYRLKVVSPDGYQPKNEALVIVDPLSIVSTDTRITVWGRDDESVDINFVIDENKMYSSFSSIPFIYPEGDAYASMVLSENPDLVPVSYSGRISNVNIDSVLKSIEGFDSVILFDPESSTLLLDSADCDFIVDFRYHPALSKYKNVKGITPDWDEAIRNALSGESGDIPFDFTLR